MLLDKAQHNNTSVGNTYDIHWWRNNQDYHLEKFMAHLFYKKQHVSWKKNTKLCYLHSIHAHIFVYLISNSTVEHVEIVTTNSLSLTDDYWQKCDVVVIV